MALSHLGHFNESNCDGESYKVPWKYILISGHVWNFKTKHVCRVSRLFQCGVIKASFNSKQEHIKRYLSYWTAHSSYSSPPSKWRTCLRMSNACVQTLIPHKLRTGYDVCQTQTACRQESARWNKDLLATTRTSVLGLFPLTQKCHSSAITHPTPPRPTQRIIMVPLPSLVRLNGQNSLYCLLVQKHSKICGDAKSWTVMLLNKGGWLQCLGVFSHWNILYRLATKGRLRTWAPRLQSICDSWRESGGNQPESASLLYSCFVELKSTLMRLSEQSRWANSFDKKKQSMPQIHCESAWSNHTST